MTITDMAGVSTFVEELRSPAQELIPERCDRLRPFSRDRAPNFGKGLLEVLVPVLAYSRRPSPVSNLVVGFRACMEYGELVRKRRQLLLHHCVPAKHARHGPFVWNTPHLHGVLNGFACVRIATAGEKPLVRASNNRYDLEIDAIAKPAVQPNLLLAHVASAFQCRVVEKAKVERLLKLVRKLSGEENVRDVRLKKIDGARRMRKGVRAQEISNVGGKVPPSRAASCRSVP